MKLLLGIIIGLIAGIYVGHKANSGLKIKHVGKLDLTERYTPTFSKPKIPGED